MARKIYRSSLSKRQREQYDNLKSRGFEITPQQVREYFRDARKINKEFNKQFENRFVEEINIASDLSFAKNQEQLNRWLAKNEYFAKETNHLIDEIEKTNIARFTENLSNIFPELSPILERLSPRELREFIDKPENYRYRDLIYESIDSETIEDIINLTNSIYDNQQGLEDALIDVMKPNDKK